MLAKKDLAKSLMMIGLALGVAAGGWAAEHAHEGHGAAELTLNDGKKWTTDESLRKGMGNIRAAMAKSLHPIHEGKLSAAEYDALARKLEGEVGYIVANCRLDQDADAQLHGVLAQLSEGIDQMKGADKAANRQDGAVKVIRALDAYGKHFDHPGWKSLEH